MFRCKDCKLEYTKKPEYCKCGNNSFEEITPQNGENALAREKNTSNKTFFEQYPQVKRFVNSLDILSTSIFITCLILSILAWIFIGKENPNVKHGKKPVKQVQEKVKKNEKIPNIDSFWNNATPKVKTPILPQPFEEPTLPEHNEPRVFVPPIAPRVHNVPENRNVISPPIPTKRVNSSSTAMSTYKGALRQVLFSHLSVASVLGAGKCEIEFSIDRSGRLLNRKFSRLSDNKSLNDAVYNMLMSVPQYYAPPAEYNGEKIRLKFTFDNGYYEVSY